jgi:hypothetical protein
MIEIHWSTSYTIYYVSTRCYGRNDINVVYTTVFPINIILSTSL